MHAVIMREFGAAEVLRPGEFPDPTARPGWLTVALQASAQRVTSITSIVNSARKKSVICDRRFKMSIVLSGVFATSAPICGCSKELL